MICSKGGGVLGKYRDDIIESREVIATELEKIGEAKAKIKELNEELKFQISYNKDTLKM